MGKLKRLVKGKSAGNILVYEVLIMFIITTALFGILNNGVQQLRVIRASINGEQAFQIAEAGINYYQWRLAHYPTDFQDGTGQPGPYVHDYKDIDTQDMIGRYSLQIMPPSPGSTVVTITSTGYTFNNPYQKRTITVQYGIPSLAKYAFLSNSGAWIGSTESVNGEMHANGGIRFDGTADSPITSAKLTYTCPSWQGCSGNPSKPGIWGSASQSTKNFWQFPVPNADFSSITSDLSAIKSDAQDSGIYLPPTSKPGYSLVFKADGTVDIYQVNTLRSHVRGWDVNNAAHNEDLDYNQRVFLYNRSIPANGLIFIEDQTWVEGTVRGRALVAAAILPYNAGTSPSILIPNNILYTAKDGTDSLGLIAQKDVLLTYYSPNNLEVDAAMIAQYGSAQHYNFSQGSCVPNNVKNRVTIYGSIASYGVWTWSWVCSGTIISGYRYTTTSYDPFLLYSPPPSFPLTPGGYRQLTWTSK